MSLIVGLIVLLRLYTRLFVQRWFGSDDVLIIISLVSPPDIAPLRNPMLTFP